MENLPAARLVLPLALTLALLVGCAPPPPAPQLPPGQDAAATATLSTNQIRIGEPVQLRLSVLHRAGTRVQLPPIGNPPDIILHNHHEHTEELPGQLRRTTHTLQLTSMTLTNHILAANTDLVITTPEGLHWKTPFPFVALDVIPTLAPNETEPRPLKRALAHWPPPPSRWVWIALAALLLLAAAGAGIWRLLSTPRTFLHHPPASPAHQIALEAIAALRAKNWIAQRHIEPFYIELSAIVRRYLEGRYGLRAPERTTEEFIRDALTARHLTPPHRQLVADFLAQSDLVKFARHQPAEPDMHNALDAATRLVRETIPTPPAPGDSP